MMTRHALWMLLLAPLALAQPKEKAPPPLTEAQQATAQRVKKLQFETLSLVLLVKGDKWAEESTPQTQVLLLDHLAHIFKLQDSGKIVAVGPLGEGDDPNLRGVALYRTSLEEARKLASQDPAVKAGLFKVVARQWNVEKGRMAFPLTDAAGKSPTK